MIWRVISSTMSLPSPNSISARCLFANMKPDLSLWWSWRKHQLADGVEDDLELGVVFVFQRRKLAGQFCVGEEHLAQSHKCAHDRNVNLHGALTRDLPIARPHHHVANAVYPTASPHVVFASPANYVVRFNALLTPCS